MSPSGFRFLRDDAITARPDGDRNVDAGPATRGADMRMLARVRIGRTAVGRMRTARTMIVPGRLDRHVSVAANAQHHRLRHIQRRQRQQQERDCIVPVSQDSQKTPVFSRSDHVAFHSGPIPAHHRHYTLPHPIKSRQICQKKLDRKICATRRARRMPVGAHGYACRHATKHSPTPRRVFGAHDKLSGNEVLPDLPGLQTSTYCVHFASLSMAQHRESPRNGVAHFSVLRCFAGFPLTRRT